MCLERAFVVVVAVVVFGVHRLVHLSPPRTAFVGKDAAAFGIVVLHAQEDNSPYATSPIVSSQQYWQQEGNNTQYSVVIATPFSETTVFSPTTMAVHLR